ncbi:ATP-binding cassette domain-containing protein [Jeongeupia naejangsanensis]|uniref:ATP-binding cassette domain-containing protein n=1 Tax=Jeongeupia naejangsanensis TaxID=613195 RepID=A0ABS2BS07_9NEIS|nr:ATP-binding cassette domain-containing protein [Jeongeupia naejangsanensis]MBM3117589.1 ATP-binding cassette domain-containing protein [Jeongeupia naejangsanensis]
MFELHDVAFTVERRALLRPTSLRFDEGQVCGLIGHNGSGKSTLLKLLARQQAPTAGTLSLDGKPVGEWQSQAFARRVAYLPQHLPSAENLLGRELVEFGRYPWRGLLGRTRTDDRERVARAIELTHTDAFADRLVDTLSGGERQRVWLAMLLAQESRFILLDEPLAALDLAHQVEVMSLIQRLSRELGLGVIVVIHDINLAARYCDRLIALHSGAVLTQGTPAELMNAATLEAIYGLPMRVMPHPVADHAIAIV